MLWILKYKKNWYGLPMETATAKTKETQGEHKWGGGFLIDVGKAMKKIDYYLEQQEVE